MDPKKVQQNLGDFFCVCFKLFAFLLLLQPSGYRDTGSSLGCAPGCYTEGRAFETPTGPTLRVFKITEEKVPPLQFICKWLVFSDNDDKPEVPSHNSLNIDNSVGR